MRTFVIVVALVATFLTGSALADYVYRDANGVIQTFFAFSCLTTKNCSAQVLIDSNGTEKATINNPLSTSDAALLTAVNGPIPAGTATIGAVLGAPNVTPVNCSGTITAGDSAQTIIAASATLRGFTIANIDPTTGSGEPLWISFTGTAAIATIGSYPLAAPVATSFAGLSSFTTPVGFGPNSNLSIIGHTTGHKFSCTRW